MSDILASIRRSIVFSGNVQNDAIELLNAYRCTVTAEHVLRVADEAARLASIFGADAEDARIAGLLHDISAIIPNSERIGAAQELGIDILPEEITFPMIIHQKISRIIARDVFHIDNPDILDAIECHTTLKANSSLMDLIVFVADKIEWDQPGKPPYLDELLPKLDVSLEQAAFVYIDYLWKQRDKLKVVHPWLIDAYYDLKTKLSEAGSDI